MPSNHEWVVLLLAAVAVSVVVSAGPVPGPAEEEPEPETLVENAAESIRSSPIEGIRTETFERANETERVTLAVEEDPPDRARITTVAASDSNLTADEKVINRSTLWRYDEEEGRVVRKETDGYWISDTQSFGMDIREMRKTYEFEFAGTETVNGHETYVVEMSPPDDEAVELSLDLQAGSDDREIPLYQVGDDSWVLAQETWWIDVETDYPIKQRIEWADANGTIVARTTRTYEELETGVAHGNDTFEFDPPAEAEVVDSEMDDTENFEDRDEAAQAVPFALPEPELSEEFELVTVSIPDRGNRTSAILLYYDGAESISIGVSNGPQIVPEEDVVERNVGTINGTIVAQERRAFVSWTCGDLSYRVHGPSDTERLIGTAESIGCDTSDRRS